MTNSTELSQRAPEDEKPWWKSKGVLGSLGTILIPIAGMAGVEISGGDISQAVELVVQTAAVVSGVIALIGRITARSRVR